MLEVEKTFSKSLNFYLFPGDKNPEGTKERIGKMGKSVMWSGKKWMAVLWRTGGQQGLHSQQREEMMGIISKASWTALRNLMKAEENQKLARIPP